MDLLDEQRMCRLYEKFILEYYQKEHPEVTASATQIPWQLDVPLRDTAMILLGLSTGIRACYFRLKYGLGECILILNFSAAICWFSEK